MIIDNWGYASFYRSTGRRITFEKRPGSGRPTKMTAAVKALIEQKMSNDDETTAVQLHTLLLPNCPWSLYSAMNRSRTVRTFCLNGEGVLYNEKDHSVFVSFRKNEMVLLYCHILYTYVCLCFLFPPCVLTECMGSSQAGSHQCPYNHWQDPRAGKEGGDGNAEKDSQPAHDGPAQRGRRQE